MSFFRTECLVLWRRKQDVLNALLFFIMVVMLFPLGVDSSAKFLTPASGGIIWCAIVLACLIGIEGMFKADYTSGVLEQWVTSGLSLPVLVLLKVMIQWFSITLPLLVMMPLLKEMLYIPPKSFEALVMTLVVGSPSLFLLGSIGAALTVSLKQGATLLILLILPFFLPIVIFATSAIKAATLDLPYIGLIALLSATSLLFLVVSPFMAAIMIKASVN